MHGRAILNARCMRCIHHRQFAKAATASCKVFVEAIVTAFCSATYCVTMPESNKAAKKRIQKANRAAGIGDDTGRILREKEPPKMSKCTICQQELKITKTNTELIAHASSKHGKTIEECFPGAKETAAELAAAVGGGKGGGKSSGGSGMTKAERKKKEAAGMDDMLSAGLNVGKKKGKK